MVIIGIDFGNDSSIVTTVQNNRVETVDNDYFERKTPSIVAFTDKNRVIGVAAKYQQSTNIENTAYDFKTYLCGIYHRPPQLELITIRTHEKRLLYSVSCQNKTFLGSFNPVEITEMLFSKLKTDTEVTLNSTVDGCVIAYPSYFNDSGRKKMLIAAGMAGLNCYYMIKETTAVAIDYGFYKRFPMRKNIFFVDFGQSSIQVFAVAFTDKKLEVLAEVSALIGGRDIDERLAKHFLDKLEHLNEPLARKGNKKFCLRLLEEVEKLKKKISIDTVEMSLNLNTFLKVETLPEKLLSMDRAKMDEICNPIYEQVESLMKQCLKDSNLRVHDIDAVEIVGGSSRIPAIKNIIHKVFKRPASNTMNQDEAVARGCLLRFITSTKKKDFEIVENFQSEEMESKWDMQENIQVETLHPNFKGDKLEFLNVELKTINDYLKTKREMIKNDEKEMERLQARNKFDELADTIKRSGKLEKLEEKVKFLILGFITEKSNLHDETTQKYIAYHSELCDLVDVAIKNQEKREKKEKSNRQTAQPCPIEETFSNFNAKFKGDNSDAEPNHETIIDNRSTQTVIVVDEQSNESNDQCKDSDAKERSSNNAPELAVDALDNSELMSIEYSDSCSEVLSKIDFHDTPNNSTDSAAMMVSQSGNHEESIETDDERMDESDSTCPSDKQADQATSDDSYFILKNQCFDQWFELSELRTKRLLECNKHPDLVRIIIEAVECVKEFDRIQAYSRISDSLAVKIRNHMRESMKESKYAEEMHNYSMFKISIQVALDLLKPWKSTPI